MTPDKGKKPLPSSTSLVLLEEPQSSHEWRYVLKIIKIEYQKGNWKHSLNRCNQLLCAKHPPLPLHIACLHFYAALSEEAIARQMHNMSLAKIQAFQRAKSCFEHAVSSLPVPDKRENNSDSCSVDSGSDIDDTISLEDSVSSVEDPQPYDITSSLSSKQFEPSSTTLYDLKPLPLRICKKAQNGTSSFNEKKAFFESRLQASKTSPPISPTTKSPGFKKTLQTKPPPPSPKDRLRKTSDSHVIPMTHSYFPAITSFQSRAQERYNDQLLDFAQMLAKHVHFVDEAISQTQEAQATGRRRLIKERKTGTDDADEKAVDLRARIARLKKKGWVRERFVPGKYQNLCAKALAEL